ncbi:hypothetical protein BKA58DRAFT_376524 [Alternaria rosae]|uniref:uncharacterized protein n=1 Tax=Alternaria rosae TaxID=1187941 RepID=UPI001E8E8E98|nr:uncharacterized protein BKA58DRAFT_376524 [Alternaria rosae]KAH6878105.1 hypothetical protein BKA58DRAFT_376524 [Alternaria rosae]
MRSRTSPSASALPLSPRQPCFFLSLTLQMRAECLLYDGCGLYSFRSIVWKQCDRLSFVRSRAERVANLLKRISSLKRYVNIPALDPMIYADVRKKRTYEYLTRAGNLIPLEQARCRSVGYLGYMPWQSGSSTIEPAVCCFALGGKRCTLKPTLTLDMLVCLF